MGAPVEGMKYQEIEDKYGFVKDYLPYQHYGNGWIENQEQQKMVLKRQKLMITAIMEKKDRVAEDVRTAWVKYANPNAGGWVSETV